MESALAWHAGDTTDELEYRYHAEPVPALRPRWQALWLLRQGYPRKTVARLVGINPRTLRDWIAWYRIGGCAEVARHRLGTGNGQACRLTEEQLAELAAWAADGTFYTYADARQWVADTWQVYYTYDGMRSLLDRMGIHPRVPRPLAGAADLAAQEAWKKGGSVRRSARSKRLTPRGWAGVMSSGSDSRALRVGCSHPGG
jgi:transposase